MSDAKPTYIPWGRDGMTEEVPDDFFQIDASRAKKFFTAFVPALPRRIDYLETFVSEYLQRTWTLRNSADELAHLAHIVLETAPTRRETPEEIEAAIMKLAAQMGVNRRIVESTVRGESSTPSIPLDPMAWNSWHADIGIMMYTLAAQQVDLPPWKLDTRCFIDQRRNQPYLYFSRGYEWWPIFCGKSTVFALGEHRSGSILASRMMLQMNVILDCKYQNDHLITANASKSIKPPPTAAPKPAAKRKGYKKSDPG